MIIYTRIFLLLFQVVIPTIQGFAIFKIKVSRFSLNLKN